MEILKKVEAKLTELQQEREKETRVGQLQKKTTTFACAKL